jgi:hypothetical protein
MSHPPAAGSSGGAGRAPGNRERLEDSLGFSPLCGKNS